jgi:DNA-binding transcriptional MerR regulator
VDREKEKLYFSIGEVSKVTGLPPSVLRFWEGQFKEFRPQKSRGGHRRYQKKDVELILRIKKLLYEQGFTIEGAKKELGKQNKEENFLSLTKLKEELEELLKILN